MIRAAELFPTLNAPRHLEVARLTDLQSQLPSEPLSDRAALGQELLGIIEGSEENLKEGILAGFAIARHAKDLNLVNSESASRLLVIWETNLARSLSAPLVAFLFGLISALRAIDSKRADEALKQACQIAAPAEYRSQFIDLAEKWGFKQ